PRERRAGDTKDAAMNDKPSPVGQTVPDLVDAKTCQTRVRATEHTGGAFRFLSQAVVGGRAHREP
ncbi:MAG: hypothetical protein MUP97_02470, partial [Acidimicrobiia bacterium]|nr:hypothetical protein [Acidimicrobiia bacterium]